jgi:CheY-like chemotaxis protein
LFSILMADDDPDDRMMAKEALDEAGLNVKFDTVNDGENLLDYLHQRGEYERFKGDALPELILLDLNMPKLDGREALRSIRSEPTLKHIPVVAFTTSSEAIDVRRMYTLGVNSFLVKPANFSTLVDLMKTLFHYWSETAHVPGHAPEGGTHE